LAMTVPQNAEGEAYRQLEEPAPRRRTSCCAGLANKVVDKVVAALHPGHPELGRRDEEWSYASLRQEVVSSLLESSSALARGSRVEGMRQIDPQVPGLGSERSTSLGYQGSDFQDRQETDLEWIQKACAEKGLEVTEALVWQTIGKVGHARLQFQCPHQRHQIGKEYISATTGFGAPSPLGDDENKKRHAIPWFRPPRSQFYIKVRETDFVADPATLTAVEPQNGDIFPGWNMLIAVTDSEWTWQMFFSVWNVVLFAVTTVTAFQQGLTLRNYGFGLGRTAMYWVATVFKIIGPFWFARKGHKSDADMPDGRHRVGHWLRDLFCQVVGIRWLVRNAHRAITPEYLARAKVDGVAQNVGSRLGCRVPLVYTGPSANELWTEKEHMKHRLIWTVGADAVLLSMSLPLLLRSMDELQTHASVVIAVENCVSLFISFVVSLWHFMGMRQGLSLAQRYADEQLRFAQLRQQQGERGQLLSEHAQQAATRMKNITGPALRESSWHFGWVVGVWLLVVLALVKTT